jgi:tripartite ATP-independent transporter DctM subunit
VIDVVAPIALLVLLIVTGIPIGFALMISGIVGISMVTTPDVALGVLQTLPFRESSAYALVTIPMFVLMAEFITKGGLAKDIFDALKLWSGRVPGGAVVATIFASAGLGAICGSSAAAASTMGRAAIPELKRLGYSPSFSVGSVAVAGTLAIMIPPSTGLLLYALLTGTTIGGMLIAGILPGILIAVAFAVLAVVRARRAIARGEASRGSRYTIGQKLAAASTLWPFALLIGGILYGIYSGIVSAIEASALGALLALVILVVLRRISGSEFVDAVRGTAQLTSMIFIIIVGAGLFGYFLTVARIPDKLLESLVSAGLGRWGVLLVILFAIFVLGFFMDQIAILSLAIPIVFPIVQNLEFDAIWFGILFTCLAEIGMVTPPMGLNVFVASAAGGETAETGFIGVWPYVAVLGVVLVILILVPQISTALVPASLG